MNILFLGYEDNSLIKFLKKNNKVVQTAEKISYKQVAKIKPSLILSYGYRHIIKGKILYEYEDKIINLHISYLPWNRGVYPNIWSVIDNTPKGITIHMIDKGIDTGDILYQKKVNIGSTDTVSESYFRLRQEIEDLFIENWEEIKENKFIRKKQNLDKSTFHDIKNSKIYFKKLGILDNWELTMEEIKKRHDTYIINENI